MKDTLADWVDIFERMFQEARSYKVGERSPAMLVKVPTKCPLCLKSDELEVDLEGYVNWENGMLIQEALPDLTADQREALITGIDTECWEKYINTEDEVERLEVDGNET